MAVLIVNAGLIGATYNSAPSMADRGAYLQEYDPEFAGGRGKAVWTRDKARAKRFADMGAALAEWKRQSKTMPLRPWDGHPNRPLTAYTITFETVED